MVLVTNGRLITRDSEGKGYYEHGAVAYEGAKIVEVGEEAALRAKYPDAEIIDAKGGVIMPAFINAHTHIYSALARGLSIVGNNPTNFYEVLDGTWWAIDRHLMMDGTRASATALYMDSIKQGVTTIFDHHASYGEIPGTLFTISEESRRLGLRSCLCYEVSDRDGEEKCLQAINENADFITYCQKQNDPMLAAMFGGHALFTISDKTFDRMVEANNGRTGYHIHVSEGMNDVYDSLQPRVQHGQRHRHLPGIAAVQAGHPAGHGHRRLYQRHAGVPEGGAVLPAEPELPAQRGLVRGHGHAVQEQRQDRRAVLPRSAGRAEGRRCGGYHRDGL